MSRSNLPVILLRVLFGLLCILAVFMLLLTPFMFDNPAASKNPLTRNLAMAPMVYLALFAISLIPARTPKDPAKARRAGIAWALLPLAGIAWYGVALLLLQVFCGGSFACR